MAPVRSFTEYAVDCALVIGGAAAVLLQLEDPVVGRAVAVSSAFSAHTMRRLTNTLGYVYAVSIGTPAQADRVAGHVERAHSVVPGASDPQRQLWVAATLYEVGHAVHERLFGAVPASVDEQILRESARLGTALRMGPEDWPADCAAFARYWTDAVDELVVTDEARATARELLHPQNVPGWVRAAMPLARIVTPTLLPASVAAAYGFRSRPARERLAWMLLTAAAWLAPRRLRTLPARRLLAGIR